MFAQASILQLYDPDRSRTPIQRSDGVEFERSWKDFAAFVREWRANSTGEGFAVLRGESPSVVEEDAVARLLRRFPKARVYRHEAVSHGNESEGLALATGRRATLLPKLEDARIIVDLDANLLIDHPGAAQHSLLLARPAPRAERNESSLLL